MDIIDRRPNPHGKSLENRVRVLNRAKAAVTRAAQAAIAARSLRDAGKGEDGRGEAVTVPARTLAEPGFHTVFSGGAREHVLPGNKSFSTGDRIPRPPGGGGGGGGSGPGAGQGDGEDSFRFLLTRDEFLDLFFDDLELPDLVKRQIKDMEKPAPSRAGFTVSGNPAQLDLGRTMRQSLARRIGLRRPKPAEAEALEAEIETLEASGADPARLEAARLELDEVMRRRGRVPFIDPIDIRYRNFEQVPRPSSKAVMFCLMDVSGSMTEPMKEMAKRFFLLLNVFLERRYKRVDLVFIRHTETAQEVDEDAFFHDPRTGGTVVSSALTEMIRIQRERYPATEWNIYGAQASDGDNHPSDTGHAVALLEAEILPAVQHYAYIEIGTPEALLHRTSDLWRGYAGLAARAERLALRRVSEQRDIFPVFRSLFSRGEARARERAP
ncbi:YeaH/YhbH family protein [Pseudoroseomonas sp. WGS1072]|uniref:YeaH/YhbH family protein n=1 Tax=Roseomonas sp. WGS1072 TaxID=3366816 RepID=UPI003BF2C840